MFKRKPRSYFRTLIEFFYPRGGWYRAALYVLHRIKRLPDPAHRISRGIAAGVFVCFTPFFGMHFILAAAIAWLMRGNVLAALLATFVGNPLTFPIIAEASVRLGALILGGDASVNLPEVAQGFGHALHDVWFNLRAIFTHHAADWHDVAVFYRRVFLPYLVGGIPLGVAAGLGAYAGSLPVIQAYQRHRARKLQERHERRMAGRRLREDDTG